MDPLQYAMRKRHVAGEKSSWGNSTRSMILEIFVASRNVYRYRVNGIKLLRTSRELLG